MQSEDQKEEPKEIENPKRIGVLMFHPNCGHTWIYKGNREFTSCSGCRSKINVERNKMKEGQNYERRGRGRPFGTFKKVRLNLEQTPE